MSEFKIGPYTLSEYPDDSCDFWIRHENGEGMETTEEKLVKMLEEFWKTEF